MVRRKGRPQLIPGQTSVPINVRLPASEFDLLCRRALLLERQLDRSVSLAEALRRKLALPVNEEVYGPDDGRPPLDARHVDAIVYSVQKEASSIARESLEIAKDAAASECAAMGVARQLSVVVDTLITAASVLLASRHDPDFDLICDHVQSRIQELIFPDPKIQ